jgi:hypothetical protein
VQAGEAVVDDETGRIDNHFAGVDLGLEKIGKDFAGREVRIACGTYVQAQRTRQDTVEIQPEKIGVAPVVVGVGKHPLGVGRDRSVAHIRLIAQPEQRLALRSRIGAAILDPVEKPNDLIVKAAFGGHRVGNRRTQLIRELGYLTHT